MQREFQGHPDPAGVGRVESLVGKVGESLVGSPCVTVTGQNDTA